MIIKSNQNNPDTPYSLQYKNPAHYPAFLLIVLLFVVAASSIYPGTSAAHHNPAFDWSMPDRLLENQTFPGFNPGSPIPQYDPNAMMLPPAGWTVNFNACASTASTISTTIVSYEWFVDSVSVGVVNQCTFDYTFPQEGTYLIALKLTDEKGSSETLEQEITVQDWLIIALGDSYGSGEGNPLLPVSLDAHAEFNVLVELVDNISDELDAAWVQLPGLEETERAANQLYQDTLATLIQAENDLNQLIKDLDEMLIIETRVENDPVVIAARDNVIRAQRNVADKRAKVNAAQRDYNNCTFLNCAARLAILTIAKTELAAAETDLIAAQAALLAARSTAVILYSAIATIQNFSALTLALDAKRSAVNLARNSFNTAKNVYDNAAAAWQQAKDALASLESIIADLQQAWETAKTNALTKYLNTLPVWTETPPSWGTDEPDFVEIVLNGAVPGEALRCHRSMISGQARAALALEQADPHTSVTLVHLSCSGAKISTGLNDVHGGQPINAILEPLIRSLLLPELPALPKITSQIKAAAEVAAGREVDAIVISIGGNDVKFSTIIENCIVGEPCHDTTALPPSEDFTDAQKLAVQQNCNPGSFVNFLFGSSLPAGKLSFTELCLSVYDKAASESEPGTALVTFNEALTRLPGQWQNLNAELKKDEHFPSLDSGRVYLTEYPDPTGDDNGDYCAWDPSQTTTLGHEIKNIPGITLPEIFWADTVVGSTLRNETAAAAAKYQWKFITETGINGQTISSASRKHGYCADNHWVVRIPESLLNQQDHLGSVHPNRQGQEIYKQAIYTQLVQDFYPNGLYASPRAPDPGQVTPLPLQSFIERLYQNILRRIADRDGLAYWLNMLHTQSAAYVVQGFFYSQEFADLNLDDAAFINILYESILGRAADKSGRDYWVSRLQNGRLRDMVLYGFLKSQEFTDLAERLSIIGFSQDDQALYQLKQFVLRFYQKVLKRKADVQGFDYWVAQLNSGSQSAGDIARNFFFSNEFSRLNYNDSSFIDIAYQTILNRASDQTGKNYWLGQLAGGLTRPGLINAFIASQEFSDLANFYGIRVK